MDRSEQSVGELVRLANEQLGSLVRHELEFARTELMGKAKRAGAGAGLFGAAAVLAVAGLAVLITTIVLAIALALPAWLSALIVAVALFMAAGIAAVIGRARLKASTPMTPAESVTQLRADVSAVTSAAKDGRRS